MSTRSTPQHARPRARNDVVISRRGIEALRHGHPWIYRSAIDHAPAGGDASGTIVAIRSESGELVGRGVYDATSPIAVRVWSLGEATLDASTFRARLERAIAIRADLFGDGATTAYRLANGEGDRMPGFVFDRYGDVAVLRLDGDAARIVDATLTRDVERVLRGIGITTLLERAPRGEEKKTIVRFGEMRERIEVKEHGVPFVVDLARGQKTGAFLDQRENRRRVGELVMRRPGARVLNLFSYAGGFSQRAALAGGIVTSVDIAMSAHATAQESFRVAGIDPQRHAFVTADAFSWLEGARKRGDTWDVVVSDPPSFAPSEKAKPKAISAYRALHRACVEVLRPEGVLVAASCSSHIGAEEFVGLLDDAALGRSDLRVLEMHGAPPDHPSLPAFFEGRYLKLAVLA